MIQHINKDDLKKIIKKIVKESVGIPSEENYYISVMVPRIKSWMDEVYQDWGGIDAVSPEALTDFSNRNDYEESLDTFAHEFNVDREELRPVFNKAIEIAHSQLKEDLLGEAKFVNQFTPYTDDEKKTNFEYLRTSFGRSPEERNPSYAAAKKAAEERRKQKEAQKQNGEVSETIHYTAERMAADNNYRMKWNEKYLKPLLDKCDAILNGSENASVQEIIDLYKRLNTIRSSNPIKYDVRLIELQDEIKDRLEKLVEFIRQMMTNRPNESKKRVKKSEIVEAIKDVLSEWKKSINEDGYSYNGLDQQAQYRKMGEELMAQQQREKNYKKNMVLFKKAFNQVYKEFSIIGTIKRKSPESKEVFNGPAFIKFVEHTEGNSLYTPIWEKYGGEYLEMANAYLENYIIKFRRKLGMN